MLNTLISLFRKNRTQNVTFCDTCGEVCDQTCRANNLLAKSEQRRAEAGLGIFR